MNEWNGMNWMRVNVIGGGLILEQTVRCVVHLQQKTGLEKPPTSGRVLIEKESVASFRGFSLFIATKNPHVYRWTEIKACGHGFKSGTAGIWFMWQYILGRPMSQALIQALVVSIICKWVVEGHPDGQRWPSLCGSPCHGRSRRSKTSWCKVWLWAFWISHMINLHLGLHLDSWALSCSGLSIGLTARHQYATHPHHLIYSHVCFLK